ncbi:multiheme c-type cytochrome [Litorilituus lipolyticus]|uniref:Cytochrome c-552/4 domain-containing protein n=1 Tax=Litorilituus lipolyticus TaxID=2491017 RepID=A0A502KVD9_9GAMM|nr:multiheme c-type cytochrome [Litorilituus lipolyticus]TPH12227.1 hypothetical protein EPA86_17955 [Litorilituus lipolyticus]
MRWSYFFILQIIIFAVVAGVVYQHEDKASLVKTPPKELAQWYKPQSKRHVWLHTMFALRREMQAMSFYAEEGDSVHLKQWSVNFKKHYLSIADMVPQWQKLLDENSLQQLENAIAQDDFQNVKLQLHTLQHGCDSCHNDYQAITALTYRTPDFSDKTMPSGEAFSDHMNKLTQQVNQVKISSQDGFTALALSSLDELKVEMNELGKVCVDCHKKDRRVYPDEDMQKTMTSLETAITSGTLKEQGRHIGTLAVLACARCHGTHRIVYGAKEKLTEEVSFKALLKHN